MSICGGIGKKTKPSIESFLSKAFSKELPAVNYLEWIKPLQRASKAVTTRD